MCPPHACPQVSYFSRFLSPGPCPANNAHLSTLWHCCSGGMNGFDEVACMCGDECGHLRACLLWGWHIRCACALLQADAKRAVANALRNRWRRRRVPSPLKVRGVRQGIHPCGAPTRQGTHPCGAPTRQGTHPCGAPTRQGTHPCGAPMR
jgi:hypothetical protein